MRAGEMPGMRDKTAPTGRTLVCANASCLKYASRHWRQWLFEFFRLEQRHRGRCGSGLGGSSRTTSRFACLAAATGLTAAAARRPSWRDAGRRTPSVSQARWLSISAAQIFAAAAASLSGPATSRSCRPSPLRAFLHHDDRAQRRQRRIRPDFRSPRHSARRPLDRIGAADVDAEFGALHRDLGGRIRLAHQSSDTDCRPTDPGIGAAVTVVRGASGSISFAGRDVGRRHHRFRRHRAALPASRAGGFGGACPADETVAGTAPARSATGFCGAAGAVATGAVRGRSCCGGCRLPGRPQPGHGDFAAAAATGCGRCAGAGAGLRRRRLARAGVAACGDAAAGGDFAARSRRSRNPAPVPER